METTQKETEKKEVIKIAKLELSVRRKNLNYGLPGDDPTIHNPKIGSSLRGKSPLSGLSLEEELKYLPEIIGTSPSDVNWRKEVREYWNNISEKVPHDAESINNKLPGRVISVEVIFKDEKAFKTFNESLSFEAKAKIIEKYGEVSPADVPDYVLFRYCLVYNRVANDIKDIYKSNRIDFYLYSREQDVKKSFDGFKQRSQAMALFMDIVDNKKDDKVDAILRLFKENPDNEDLFDSVEEKYLRIETLIKSNPNDFITYANDNNLAVKAFIFKAVSKNIIINPANTESYYYGEDKEVLLGHSLIDAVRFLKSSELKNKEIVDSIKARLKY